MKIPDSIKTKSYNRQKDPKFGDNFQNILSQMMEEFLQQSGLWVGPSMSFDDMNALIFNSGDYDTVVRFSLCLAGQLTDALYHPESIRFIDNNLN